MLILNNDELQRIVTMNQVMPAVENAYLELFRGEATCMPRCNVELPTKLPGKTYAMGITAGGSSTNGYLTIRLQSDVTYLQEQNGLQTREKYCVKPGTWCGLYLLFDADNGEPLAVMNDGYLQHMRQGADGGIGAKYMAREDARVLGILGSGGMARTHAPAICLARNITRIKVYSPTRENREAFAREMAATLGVEVEPVDHPRKAHEGVDILATCADAQQPIAIGEWLEPGTHVVYAAGALDQNAADKVDVTLRLGNTPSPRGKDWQERSDTVVWAADLLTKASHGRAAAGVIPRDREIGLRDLLAGTATGRTQREQITHSDRGGMRGVEHNVVAGRAYELAKQQGFGREIPTEWFLQNIRD